MVPVLWVKMIMVLCLHHQCYLREAGHIRNRVLAKIWINWKRSVWVIETVRILSWLIIWGLQLILMLRRNRRSIRTWLRDWMSKLRRENWLDFCQKMGNSINANIQKNKILVNWRYSRVLGRWEVFWWRMNQWVLLRGRVFIWFRVIMIGVWLLSWKVIW